MKIVALYARVSTSRQEKEATIDSQVAEIKERIKQDGNVLDEGLTFADNGWSGDLLARPALDVMRDTAARKEFEILYIWDRDRIARKFYLQELILEELEGLGIEIVDLHSSKAETPEDKILLGFKGLFAEYEKAKIAERMRRGKLFKARSGKIVHGSGSFGPYGYRYVLKTQDKDGYYLIDNREADVVRQIFRWIADEGLTIRKVIKRLNELKIYPRKRKREFWTNGPLCRLLRNETYIGTTYYNKSMAIIPEKPKKNEKYKRVKKSSRQVRPKSEWIPIPVSSIIDEELFYRAQKQLEINAQLSPRNKKHDYFLSGVIYCECGARMGCEGSGGQYYYRCQNRLKRYPLPRDCFAGGVNTQRIDGVVWGKIKQLLTDPTLIKKQAERWLSQKQSGNDNFQPMETEKLEKALESLAKEEKRQAEAYGAGLLSFEVFKNLMADLKTRRTSLEDQLRLAKTQELGVREKLSLTIEEICRYAPKVVESLLEEKEKQQALRKLVDKVTVNKDRTCATIGGYIPIYEEAHLNVEFWSISRDSWVAKFREIDPI